MYNDNSLRAVAAARRPDGFVRPLYESYCFAQLPALVQAVLPGGAPGPADARLLGPLAGTYDQVVLLFVDAFGWRFFERWADRDPFLRAAVAEGYVSKLTSQFPSTTAAHVTTIHTGLPVGQSGVLEWHYYEPQLDAMIAPLLFSFAGDARRDTLLTTGVPARSLFPASTVYHALARQGVNSYVFQNHEYTPSPYSDVVFAGARVRPYRTLPEALTLLADALAAATAPTYCFLYFEKIDTLGHEHGPHSRATSPPRPMRFWPRSRPC